jgi:hypothetical protein
MASGQQHPRSVGSEGEQQTHADNWTYLSGKPAHIHSRQKKADGKSCVARKDKLRRDTGRIGYINGSIGEDEQTEELLTAVLMSTLAGRAAEEVILDSVSANSGGVEQSVSHCRTALALDMETLLGFARKWPLLYRKTTVTAACFAAHADLAARVNARLDNAYEVVRKTIQQQTEAGSEGEMNFGATSRAASKAASSRVARYSRTARPAPAPRSAARHSSPGTERCLLASAAMRLASTANPSPPIRPSLR